MQVRSKAAKSEVLHYVQAAGPPKQILFLASGQSMSISVTQHNPKKPRSWIWKGICMQI